MFITLTHPSVRPVGPDPVAVPYAPPIAELSPRALHARLLDNAAARRRRAVERRHADRGDDADYWFSAAPLAVRKACALREERSFAPLP